MQDAGASPDRKLVTELKVSGHLMTLDTGLFCILNKAPSQGGDLPGVRISRPPGRGRNAVSISSFQEDGWLAGADDAALVRVSAGPAQILVTVYQAPDGQGGAPNLQVLRLTEHANGAANGTAHMAAPAPAPAPRATPKPPAGPRVAAHVQRRGDIAAALGEWIGDRGSRQWVEGFAIAAPEGLSAEDIEYQAVLGRGWLSPWVEAGQFCGSRGMALPLLGLRVRLRGAAAEAYECALSATFVDGTEIGPVGSGAPCEAESLAPLEAFQLILRPIAAAAEAPRAPARTRAAKPVKAPAAPAAQAARPAKKPAAKTTAQPAPEPARPARLKPRAAPAKTVRAALVVSPRLPAPRLPAPRLPSPRLPPAKLRRGKPAKAAIKPTGRRSR